MIMNLGEIDGSWVYIFQLDKVKDELEKLYMHWEGLCSIRELPFDSTGKQPDSPG